VQLSGSLGFGGIIAQGLGGNGGLGDYENGDNGQYGGGGGVVVVNNSAPVTVNWTWQNQSSTPSGLFGVLAQSVGGFGTQSQEDDNNGGAGGAAQSASVELLAGGAVTVVQNGTANALGAALPSS